MPRRSPKRTSRKRAPPTARSAVARRTAAKTAPRRAARRPSPRRATPERMAEREAAQVSRAAFRRAGVRPRHGTPPPHFDVPEGWTLNTGANRLHLAVRTKDFAEALRVMDEVGRVAERLNHHPDLHLQRYNHLTIETYSHDVGRLTERDERLARRISDVLAKRGLLPG